jgi:hypothetical protein
MVMNWKESKRIYFQGSIILPLVLTEANHGRFEEVQDSKQNFSSVFLKRL